MRKLTNIIIVVLMSLIIFAGFSTSGQATASKKVNVKVEVGFDKNYKVGYSAPITMTIDNKYKDIKGEVEIRVPSSAGKYVSYVKQLSMQNNSQKVITINVPISGQRTEYKIVISNGKEVVYEDKISINNTSNNVTQFIGILSDDSDSVAYINSVPSNAGISLVTKSIMLNEKNFPVDFLALKNFDILVINNFDTTKLNKEQYEVLKQWVKDGGTLLIGTGINQAKTLGLFKDNFIKGNIGKVSTVSTSKINNIATNGDNNNKLNIEALDLKIENSKVNMEENGVSLVQSLSVGKGVVGILAFDLGLSPFTSWSNNSMFAQKLIEIINPNLVKINQGNMMYPDQNVWNIKNIMNQFSEMASAKTGSFYIIIFIYIIIVAPLSYIILKKLDKREFMWITVPALAVVFGFIVFVSGAGGRINKVTANIVSTIYMDEKGNAGISTYAGIFTTNKMKLKVSSKAGKRLFNMADPNNGNNSIVTGNEELEAKVYVDGNKGLEYVNSSIMENKLMQIEQQNLNLGKIETNVKVKAGRIIGNIKNLTEIDLEDCYIVTTGEYYKIGDMKAGQGKVIPVTSGTYQGNINQFANQVIMGYNQNGNQGNMAQAQVNTTKFVDNNQKQAMLMLMFQGNSMISDGIKFIGFSKTPIEAPIIINNGTDAVKNERTVLVMPINVSFIDGNNVNYPMGFVPFEVAPSNSIKYDNFNKRLFGSEDAEIEYSIDKKVNVEQVIIETSNLSKGNSQFVINIYNFISSKYEKLQDATINIDSLKKYLNKDNKIKIKLEIKNGGDSAIPNISASGKVK